jgi:hypothetical protein
MLEVKCPACRAGGRVPRDKKNNRLVCKKCLRVFHLLPSGQAVLGEPPEQKDMPAERAPREASGYDFAGSFDGISSGLGKLKLPKVSPRALGIAAAVAVVAALGYVILSAESLDTRCKRVARAIIKTDMKPVIDLALPETTTDIIIWSNDVLRRYLDLKLALGGIDAGVTLKHLTESSASPAVVAVVFSAEGTRLGNAGVDVFQPFPVQANQKASYEIHLYWVKDGFGNWLLDGTRTASQPH